MSAWTQGMTAHGEVWPVGTDLVEPVRPSMWCCRHRHQHGPTRPSPRRSLAQAQGEKCGTAIGIQVSFAANDNSERMTSTPMTSDGLQRACMMNRSERKPDKALGIGPRLENRGETTDASIGQDLQGVH